MMKRFLLMALMVMVGTIAYSQSLQEKMAAKLAAKGGGKSNASEAKAVEPADGEYSDPSGLSGTYYATSHLPYGNTKKAVKVLKLEYNPEKGKAILHAAKDETDPDVMWMEDWMKYARDNVNISMLKAGDFYLFTIEPGVFVFGGYKRAPEDYPGYTDKMMIADTSKLLPVIFVKDESQIGKYTVADAKRLIGEQATICEIANLMRIGEKTPVPSVGKMNSDKVLVERAIGLMKAKWADSKEPENLVGCFIHDDDWGTVQYGKIMSTSKTTFSDEVRAIMLFKDKSSGLCYYYAVGISRETEDITASGIKTERGLQMTGTSTIQYITEAKLQAALAAAN